VKAKPLSCRVALWHLPADIENMGLSRDPLHRQSRHSRETRQMTMIGIIGSAGRMGQALAGVVSDLVEK